MRHKLINKDPITLIGDCVVCGPAVPLVLRKSGVLQCKAARKAQRHGSNVMHTYVRKLSGIEHCQICGSTENLVVDHDHACCSTTRGASCGKCIRGVLCTKCNTGLGHFKDDRDLIGNAYLYLAIWRE